MKTSPQRSLKTRFKEWISPPVFPGDGEDIQTARLLNTILIACFLAAWVLFVGNWLGGRTPALAWVNNLVSVAVAWQLRRWLYQGKILWTGYGLLGCIFVLTTESVVSLGTIRTPTTSAYLLMILVAGILFEWKGIVVSTLISSLAVLGIILAENAGWLPPPDFSVTITQWVTYTVLFGMVGGLTLEALQVTREALQRSKEESQKRHQIAEELRVSEARLRALFEQTHDAVFILDLQGRYLMTNQRAADMLGYSMAEMQQISMSDTSAEPDQSQWILQHLLEGETIPLYERRLRKKDGQIFPAEINLELVRDINGSPMHVQSIVREISQRKQAEEALQSAHELLSQRMQEVERLQAELREQALRDPLTGLHNRRYLGETLPREIARARRENGAVSVIVSDIDHFKTINDTYGHQVGDQLLIELAHLMKQSSRGSDVVCRYGGEEFLLILPGANQADAVQHAEELRQRCIETGIQFEGKDLRVSMSFGVATYPVHGQEAECIIICADKALYHSKNTGRNRVSLWNETQSLPQ